MHPEILRVMVESHHAYLRSLQHDSLLDDLLHAGRLLRRGTGHLLVLTGERLAGHAPHSAGPEPRIAAQQL